MDHVRANVQCRCGGAMEAGFATSYAVMAGALTRTQSQLIFVVRGEPTSPNPVKAFQQGLDDVPANRAYIVEGWRCAACGLVELVAQESTRWIP